MKTTVNSSVSGACYAVVPAAGIGARMQTSTAKQYLEIGGKTLLEHSVGALLGCSKIEHVVVAVHPKDDRAKALLVLSDARVKIVVGGAKRCDSVLAALDSLALTAQPNDWVLVHDAARPCLLARDVSALMEAVIAQGVGGILAEPLVDTVKQTNQDARVTSTLDRSTLWRAQTPQMFRLGQLQQALRAASEQRLTVTDEASAMELQGFPVQVVLGSRSNLKVTVPEDLPLAQWYLAAKEKL